MATAGDELIGREIANGRYRVVSQLGRGAMGKVFLAYDQNLGIDVVIKFPLVGDQAHGSDFLERFAREVRSLVQLSHPHVVKVYDVGEWSDSPFVVMEYLAGGSLKDRVIAAGGPLALTSLDDWLLEIAKALDFVHGQKHIHRDVKPANILFDRHGNAYLGDFGIIKEIAGDDADWRGNSLTAPGFLVGTPNYVAPEVVMGRPFDGRVDQYSLAMTVHEVLSGINCMEGPTPSATVVNQTMVVPPALTDLIPEIPPRVSGAISRGLSKDPDGRFFSCVELAQEILAAISSPAESGWSVAQTQKITRGTPGRVPCPACQGPMPVGPEHAGGRVRCASCQATSQVTVLSSNTVQLKLIEPAATESFVLSGPDDEPEVDASAATAIAMSPWHSENSPAPAIDRSAISKRVGWLGIMAASLFGLACFAVGWSLWTGKPAAPDRAAGNVLTSVDIPRAAAPKPLAVSESEMVEVNIAFGTEKQRWLDAATAEFEKTPAGKRIAIKLHGMGSVEGARAVLEGPGSLPIQVWSPASSAYRDLFEQKWIAAHGKTPIIKAENLALTPMVFVMWRSRHEPFLKKYHGVSFPTVFQAINEPGGWKTISNQPEWGRFKFSHTHPNHSNSGLLTLVSMAYGYAKKEYNLSVADVTEPGFLEWLREFERGVIRTRGSLLGSTGDLMKEMVLRGPTDYDCLLVYENLAIDNLGPARDRWGELQVDYPEPNIWNDHPYYILDVPWSDARQRAAAAEFLKFLMTEPIQERALELGFRPGNPSVSLRFDASPFVKNAKHGLKIDVAHMSEPPRAQVVQQLLDSFSTLENQSFEKK